MVRRVALALLAGGLVVACAPGQQPAPRAGAGPVESNQVAMAKSYRFEPAEIRVRVGATVTWTNDDNFTHDVRLLGGDGWHSQPLRPGERVTHTFTQPGEFAYECTFHPQNMKGKVIVVQG